MIPRRRSGRNVVARVARMNNQPRPGTRRGGERVAIRTKPVERPRPEETDWMEPLGEDDRHALEAAWSFVE
jgi:hypothetical protein